VGSIPDDRQGMGLILSMRLFENMLLNAYDEKPYAKSPLLEDWAAARRDAQAKIADYSIAATNESVVVGTLSGGNQQKIVVARELDRGCRMLIAAQPTRGVDIASADYIQSRILTAAEQGCAVLLISSDLDELIKVSDRIMVLFRGQIMGFVDADNATREALGRMMLGEAH
jgi:nucleoside ABC transporter ATP-binding protein